MRYLIIVIALFVSTGTQAQTPPQHQHTTSNVIDGKLHPDMIQDKDAYRLFFLAMANASKEHQRAALTNHAHLKDVEAESTSTVLVDFKAKYEDLIQRFNLVAESDAARNTPTDMKAFLRDRDALVMATKAKVESVITSESAVQLNAHVQREKAYM